MSYEPFELKKAYEHNESLSLDMVLCRPDYNRTAIQSISNVYNKKLTRYLSAIDELSFDIPQKINGVDQNEEYDLIKHDYIIRLTFDDQVQYFVIKDFDENVENNKVVKSVTAYSYECTLNQKLIINWQNEQKSLADTMAILLDAYPSWALGQVDPVIMAKERTLECSEKSYYEFMQDIQKSFGCLFLFDTVARMIHIKTVDSIGVDRGFVLSNSNYMKSITIEPNYTDVVTRLYAFGKDNINVATKTSMGTTYIDNLSYFIAPFQRVSDGNGGWHVEKHSNFMTDQLCHSLLDYYDFVESKKSIMDNYNLELAELKSQLDDLLYSTSTSDEGLKTLQSNLDAKEVALSAVNKMGDTDRDLADEVKSLKVKIKNKQLEVDQKEAEIDSKQNEINLLHTQCSLDAHLTSEGLKELDHYIKEKTWRDESYVYVDDLYTDAVEMLERLSQPSIAFKVDAINYLRSIEHSIDWECVTKGMGDKIQIDVDQLGLSLKVRLVEYTFSEDGTEFNLKFSNKDSIDDPMLYLEELLKNSANTSSTVSMEKWRYRSYYNDRNEFTDWFDGTLDLTKKKALAGDAQDVVIDSRGIQLIDVQNPNKQIKLIGDLIVYTNDGWNTIGTAISSEGVFASALYGKIIAGAQLTIENANSTFKVAGDKVTITGGALEITEGLPEGQINSGSTSKWNSAESNAKAYAKTYADQESSRLENLITTEISDVNNAISALETDVVDIISDSKVTSIEANMLEQRLDGLNAESADLIAVATSLNITVQKTDYSTALSELETSLSPFINQASYPVGISSLQRVDINNCISHVQDTKSKLINEISRAREVLSKAYTDQETGALTTYVNSQIDDVNSAIGEVRNDVDDFASDLKITNIEANQLELKLSELKAESNDLIVMASSLGITAQKIAYSNAVVGLENAISPFINQASYPVAVTEAQRSAIKTSIDLVQSTKTLLANEISKVQQNKSKDYSDQINDSLTSYINGQVSDINLSLNALDAELSDVVSDGMVTQIEANQLELKLTEVSAESVDLLNVASALSVTTKKDNYATAVSNLDLELQPFVNQASYPVAITTTQRGNIDTAIDNVQSAKTELINEIARVREANANSYTDQESTALTNYINDQITGVNSAISGLETDVGNMLSDDKVTQIEANSLKLKKSEVNSESSDLVAVANTLGITTEKSNYSTALNNLNIALSPFVDQVSYPVAITSNQRDAIDTALDAVQNAKSILINKITAVREEQAKQYTDDNAVFKDTLYNGVKLNTTVGLMAIRSDNKARTTVNATDGIKIEQGNGSGTWSKKFYVDTNGYLVATDMKTSNMSATNIIIDGGKLKAGSSTLIDVGNKTINFDGFTTKSGKIGSGNIDIKGLTVRNTSNQVTFQVDGNGNLTLGGNITWASKPTYTASEVGARSSTWMPTASQVGARSTSWLPSYSEVQGSKPPTNADNTDANIMSVLTNNGAVKGMFYTSAGKLYLNADAIVTGSIDAGLIKVGTLDAERIGTGTLRIGDGSGIGTVYFNNTGRIYGVSTGDIGVTASGIFFNADMIDMRGVPDVRLPDSAMVAKFA